MSAAITMNLVASAGPWGDAAPLMASAAIAAATLWGLVAWVRDVGARSVDVSTPAPALTVLRRVLPLIVLQIACGWSALGIAGGLFNVGAAWMLVGWIFLLTLNLAPARTLRVARAIGMGGIVACGAMVATTVVMRGYA